MKMAEQLTVAAQRLAALIDERQTRIVLAESCTAGLVSATIAQVAGVSQWFCGSAVTYREETKSAWLGISLADIHEHNVVSEEVARQMAVGVLRITPEAMFSASITGHLGPGAPPELDGVVCIAVAQRVGSHLQIIRSVRETLSASDRLVRQQQAALRVLEHTQAAIAGRANGEETPA
jgi:nicotinamide-nucleotide amidase